ncbi:MAG TPA: BolA family protein [Caulobacteraceae bacterium]|nr:BolA family protein [Caulobacteraceae bacterium]
MNGPISRAIEAKLRSALSPSRLEIIDQSDAHAGHSGARPGGESHFAVRVCSAAFAGLSRLERQRLVNHLLADEFAAGLHALTLEARTPDEA